MNQQRRAVDSQENLGIFTSPRNLTLHPGCNKGDVTVSQVLLGNNTTGEIA